MRKEVNIRYYFEIFIMQLGIVKSLIVTKFGYADQNLRITWKLHSESLRRVYLLRTLVSLKVTKNSFIKIMSTINNINVHHDMINA